MRKKRIPKDRVSQKKPVSESDYQNNKNLKIIAAGAGIDLLGRIYNALLRYIFVILLARLLGAADMGIFFLAVVLVEFAAMFSRLGLETGIIKFIPMHQDAGKIKGILLHSLQISLLIALAVSAGIWLNSGAIAGIFQKAKLDVVLKIIVLGIPGSTMMWIFISGTQAFHTMKYRSSIEFFLNPSLNILLFLFFFWLGEGLKAPAWAYVVSFYFSAGIGFLALKKLFPQISKRDISADFSRRQLLSFSLPMMMVNILSMVLFWTDTMMLGYFRSAGEVGIYSAVARTAFFVNFVLMAFTSIFAPRISELYKKRQIAELGQMYKTVTRWIFSLTLPLFLIMVLFGKNLLMLFGRNFTSGFIALIFLCTGYLINASVGSVRYILSMAEKEKAVLWDTAVLCLSNIFLNWLLIPRFGIQGAAAATAISVSLINFLMLGQVVKNLKIHPYEISFLKPITAGAGGLFLYFLIEKFALHFSTALNLAFESLIFITGYFLILRILGIGEGDRAVLRSIF